MRVERREHQIADRAAGLEDRAVARVLRQQRALALTSGGRRPTPGRRELGNSRTSMALWERWAIELPRVICIRNISSRSCHGTVNR